MENNLYKKYKTEVVPALKEEFGFKNAMQIPKINKVVLNVGVGKFVKETGFIENVESTLQKITGQKPIRNKAKKAISNFKIRAGMDICVSVTLRGKRMYDFLEKLTNVTFARIRDFRGITDKGFDKQGNFSCGFKENMSFPEVRPEEIDKVHGLEIIIVTNANNKQVGKSLLKHLEFPFKK
jgi:large subunit ribosomal protein L5